MEFLYRERGQVCGGVLREREGVVAEEVTGGFIRSLGNIYPINVEQVVLMDARVDKMRGHRTSLRAGGPTKQAGGGCGGNVVV